MGLRFWETIKLHLDELNGKRNLTLVEGSEFDLVLPIPLTSTKVYTQVLQTYLQCKETSTAHLIPLTTMNKE